MELSEIKKKLASRKYSSQTNEAEGLVQILDRKQSTQLAVYIYKDDLILEDRTLSLTDGPIIRYSIDNFGMDCLVEDLEKVFKIKPW
jgi:hypothetical protein